MQGCDVFVVAPTGMGKSLCFQIPALAEQSGVSLVVSPLLALIKNQVHNLHNKGVAASALSSETSQEEKADIIKDLSSIKPVTKLLYITPERLCTNDFLNLIQQLYNNGKINRFVVDEAHCISEWGHDFRAEYRRLGLFRNRFVSVPIMALTATATSTVQGDIIQSLKMNQERLFRLQLPFNRPNLFYEIRYFSAPEASKMTDICDYIWNLHRRCGQTSSGIIYCRTRTTCETLSAYLRGKGLSARPYHRGIKPHALDKTLKEWMNGEGGVDVVVATIAFGLGIDKSDVRYVIHYDLPKSFEGFYQETGRGGRDGLPSKCILYYSREDALIVRQWVSEAHSRRVLGAINGPAPSQRSSVSLSALIQFAESTAVCRHVSICRYFGEQIDATDADILQQYCDRMCDICKYPERTRLRQGKLSSEELALSSLASNSHVHDQDDADQPNLGNDKPDRCSRMKQPNSRPAVIPEPNCRSRVPPKRPSSHTGDRAQKKPKVEMAPPLVTKPYNSESQLRRAFKTPFLPDKVSRKEPDVLPDDTMAVDSVTAEPQGEANDMEDLMNEGLDTSTAVREDIDIPLAAHEEEDSVDLDASFSRKIPLPVRYKAYHQIKRSLQRTFSSRDVCARMHCESMNSDQSILSNFARAVEFMAFSFSVTSQGYEQRVKNRLRAIEDIANREVHEVVEDNQELKQEAMDILAQFCTLTSTV
ncbi:P-loop containing nucleoside triphosphate hydrolase protein [Amanita muscaria]